MTIRWLFNDYQMTIRWLSNDYPMIIQWLSWTFDLFFLMIIDLKRCIDLRWLFDLVLLFILGWSCFSLINNCLVHPLKYIFKKCMKTDKMRHWGPVGSYWAEKSSEIFSNHFDYFLFPAYFIWFSYALIAPCVLHPSRVFSRGSLEPHRATMPYGGWVSLGSPVVTHRCPIVL